MSMTSKNVGLPKLNQAPLSDQDKTKKAIRQAGTKLFGQYTISKWELATNWNLSLWSFLFDQTYRETVQGEFYAHLQNIINTTNKCASRELPSLHDRIAKIPSDDLGDAEGILHKNGLLEKIKSFCKQKGIKLNESK